MCLGSLSWHVCTMMERNLTPAQQRHPKSSESAKGVSDTTKNQEFWGFFGGIIMAMLGNSHTSMEVKDCGSTHK